ncbi:MAG: DNA replication protein DnaD [Ruminococcaceae bacterium]|nr:DNA replication protein DnaD [Oscillospiraceae bacterium]
MNVTEVNISRDHARKLLATASSDAAIVYLYISCGNRIEEAEQNLKMSAGRISCAVATLRQLGLWEEPKRQVIPLGERPNYTENDVLSAMEQDFDFRILYGEVQRVLGKSLNTEELKILLSFTRYLGLSPDVISVLVNYCKDRQRQKGTNRAPSLRMIEKEAYAWAEKGIDTMEEAAAYIQNQNQYNTRMHHIKHLLQIHGRRLTAAEERYAHSWSEMGFDDESILMAYERTCINTGGLKWPYMNSILKRWHEAGLHTAEQVRSGDSKAQPKQERRELSPDEMEAIRRMMEEE